MTDRHMRPSDAFSWYLERDPALRSTVVVVGLLDRCPDLDLLRTRLDRATRAVPAFRDRVVLPPLRLARPRWVQVHELDMDWHIRRVAAAAPGGLAEVLEIARTAATAPFDPARPLWTFTVIDGLAEGGAAFVFAFHHALTDGVGGVNLTTELFDLAREGTPRTPAEAPAAERLDGWRLALDTARYDVSRLARLGIALPVAAARTGVQVTRHPADAVRTAASIARTVEPFVTTSSPVMRERGLSRSLHVLDVPLAELKAAARSQDAHLNDAFLAAVTGGLHRYHAEHESDVADLRVTMPISLRRDDDARGGNRITLLRFPLPVGMVDAAARVQAIRDIVKARRAERSLPHTQGIAAALNMLPAAWVGSMLKHVDFLASDVPGVPVPVFLAGAQVTSWYPFGPTTGASVNVTLMSYETTCGIGINVDTGAVPDPERLVASLAEGFEEVLALGGAHTSVHEPTKGPPAWTS